MTTIQLAIRDSEYTQSLRNSLLRDGTHRVYLVDEPDLRIDGVIVIDGSKLENLSPCGEQPERFVVITRKGSDSLSRLWNAGIRHVVFEGDSPNTAQLAIIAAELRLTNPEPKAGRVAGPAAEKHHTVPGQPFLCSTHRRAAEDAALPAYSNTVSEDFENAHSFHSLGCTRCNSGHDCDHEKGSSQDAAGR